MAEPIGNDATGYDVLTAAMKSLLNQFPGLYPDEVIKFEELGSEDGIAFSNDSGALVYTEKEDILGRIYQECRYPCFVVYRSTTGAKRTAENHYSGIPGHAGALALPRTLRD